MNLIAHDIIRRPVITERSMDMASEKKYTFEVDPGANKIQVKRAVEEIFKVKVEKVTTMNYDGKPKRMGIHAGKRKDWKKAIVKLTADSKAIEIFEA